MVTKSSYIGESAFLALEASLGDKTNGSDSIEQFHATTFIFDAPQPSIALQLSSSESRAELKLPSSSVTFTSRSICSGTKCHSTLFRLGMG